MAIRYFMAMAHVVAEYAQSDELFLMRLHDGRLIGYSSEFQYATCDIAEACSCDNVQKCSPERHHRARWFGLSAGEMKDWMPATLDEIMSLNLEKCLIGSKSDMEVDTPIDPIE